MLQQVSPNQSPSSNKIWTIIKHEYLIKVRSKGFIIGTLLAPIGIVLFFGIITFVTYMSQTSKSSGMTMLLNDRTGLIADKIIASDTTNKYIKADISIDSIKAKILSGEISAGVVLDSNAIQQGSAMIYTSENTGLTFIDNLEERIKDEIKTEQLNTAGISQETLDIINSEVKFTTVKVTSEGVVKDDSGVKTAFSYILGFAMYMLMFMYGSMVMQGVVEEKTNRIVEVLASSATPFQIMFGKVVGIGVVGLTQVILWVILCGAVLFGVGMAVTPSPEMADTMMQVQNMGMNTGGGMNTDQMADIMNSVASLHITFWHILVFVFYFLSGYFIFATLFAAIGVTVDSPTESNNLAAPLSMLIIIPILLINYVVVQPEATLSVVTSLFPFFAPILMVARVITISVPVWQIVLSVALQIVTFVLCLKFAGKIYRMGMLKYGKKTTFKDLFVWLKTK